MTCDTAKGVGKKRKNATSVRKGGRNAEKAPPAVVVDWIGFRAEPLLLNAAANSTVPAIFTPHCNNLSSYSGSGNPVQPRLVHPSQVLTCPPVNPASNATQQLNVTPQPPIGYPPERFPISQTPVVVNSASPGQDGFAINLLQLCHPSVHVCFGCSQSLKPGGDIPNPPHDLTITSKMERSYFDSITGELKSKRGNVYFHLNPNCVKRKQPYFTIQMAKIERNAAQHPRPEHFHFLRSLGFY